MLFAISDIKKRDILRFIIPILLCIIIYVVINAVSICFYSGQDETRKADVIIVLGASTMEGKVSKVYEERLNHGIALYNEKYASKIIVTGGIGKNNEMSDAYAAEQYLLSMGIPKEDILLEERSTITQENLKFAKQIMNMQHYKTALIVSDPLHMKRAILLAKSEGIESYSSPTKTSAYQSIATKIPFLAREVFFYISYKWYLGIGGLF